MNIEVKELPKSQIEFTIKLPYTETKEDREKAAQEISKSREIKGFRKGKAPINVVETSVGVAKVLEHAINYIVPRGLLRAITEQKEEHEREVIGRPEIVVKQLVPDSNVIFTAKMSVLPPVTLGDIEKVTVKPEKVEIDESKVDKAIEDIQKMRAKESAVTRKAQKGDKVLMDMDVKIAKVSVEGGKQQGMMLWIGEDKMIPGFDEKIIGSDIGQKLEFELPFPKEYHAKNLAGKTGEFEVSIKNIFETQLPEINDELVKSLGNFKTLDEFKKQLKENLKAEGEQQEDHRQEREILEKLVKQSKIGDIPDLLFEHELNMAKEELKANISQHGVDFNEWLGQIKKTEEELINDLKPQAEHRVKASLVTRQLAINKDIHVEEEEIKKEVNEQLARYAGNEQAEKNIKSQEFRDMARREVENKKVMEYLKSKCLKKD